MSRTRTTASVAFLRRAVQLGVPAVVLFANSPPARLTRSGSTTCADDGAPCNLRAGLEGEYAGYLADTALHFARLDCREERTATTPTEAAAEEEKMGEEGAWSDGGLSRRRRLRVPLVAVSPLNEPQWPWVPEGTASQEGCRASNPALARVARALRRALDVRGLPAVSVLCPESGCIPDMSALNLSAAVRFGGEPFGEYLCTLTEDPEMASALRGRNILAYHSYWSDDPCRQLVQDRATLAAAAASVPPSSANGRPWRLWQTEYCLMEGPANVLCIRSGVRLARVVHFDLSVAGAAAWSWWLGVSCYDFSDGLVYVPGPCEPWVDADTADTATAAQLPSAKAAAEEQKEVAVPSKRLFALAHFSRFVRPGYTRVGVGLSPHRPPHGPAARADSSTASGGCMGGGADAALPKGSFEASSIGGDPNGVLASAFLSPRGRTLVVVLVNAADCDADGGDAGCCAAGGGSGGGGGEGGESVAGPAAAAADILVHVGEEFWGGIPGVEAEGGSGSSTSDDDDSGGSDGWRRRGAPSPCLAEVWLTDDAHDCERVAAYPLSSEGGAAGCCCPVPVALPTLSIVTLVIRRRG